MLDQNAEKALNRAKNRSVEHHRSFVTRGARDEFQLKFLGERHIELHGSALPVSAECVADVNVDFGPVKSAISLIDPVRMAPIIESSFESIRRIFPLFI